MTRPGATPPAAPAPGRRSRSRRVLASLLADAGLDTTIESVDLLGVGTAGLNARGPRDEDGTHARARLGDGTSVIYREYATTTSAANHYQHKETAVLHALAGAGLPVPTVLASVTGSGRSGGEPAATVLSDSGGSPLDEVFRVVPHRARPALWSAVGSTLRRLHDVPTDAAAFLREPVYQRPWTRPIAYFAKSMKSVLRVRPDLAPCVADLLALRRPLVAHLDAKPQSICFSGGGYLPGMLVEGQGTAWRCASWLSLGYYVSIGDPGRDLAVIAVSHREWTGEDVPPAFYRAYGSRPDPVSEVVYEAALQLGRGAAYLRGKRRAGWGPPPHSTAIEALDRIPETVAQLRSFLG